MDFTASGTRDDAPTLGLAEPPTKPRANPGRFVPSPQQADFLECLTTRESHIMLMALAGTGKSTTAREGIKALIAADPGCHPAYVAFNRAIADEFQEKLPRGAIASTMHSMGYAALKASIRGVGAPAKFKMHDIVDTLLPRRDMATRRAKTAVVNLARLCKGYLLDGTDPAQLERLAAAHGIDLRENRATVLPLVHEVLVRCLKNPAVVDFSDMTWLPVMLGLSFPKCDCLFIDESQDLDVCQHALVRLIAGDGRLVVIGDQNQAIYMFRGADSRSMDTLGGQLRATQRGMITLPLTMTRRCPRSHVALAANIVPAFEALPEAPGGRIDERAHSSDVLRPGVLALCRTNAPLLSAAYGLIGDGIPVAIQGKDLGEGLARFIEQFDVIDSADLMDEIERYRAQETHVLSALENTEGEIESLNDRCDCVVAASRGCVTAPQVVAKVRSLFMDATPETQGRVVLLSSIHRAKGREADHVAILCPELLPHKMARTEEAMRQERNLVYVACTRARKRLSFVGGPIPSILKTGA